MTVVAAGILFSRSIRSSFASLTLAPLPFASSSSSSLQNAKERQPFLVHIQFENNLTELRSFCRKHYKLGYHMEFHASPKAFWKDKSDTSVPSSSRLWFQQPRWVVPMNSLQEATKVIVVRTNRVWEMTQCQALQKEFLLGFDNEQSASSNKSTILQPNHPDESRRNHSADGKPKRLLAEEVVRVFLKILGEEILQQHHSNETPSKTQIEQIRDFLNRGSGVLDVAGGAGHVSMALGSLGIRSTVIDSRSTVGKLPKRDRKIWKRRLKNKPPRQDGTPDGSAELRNDDFMKEFDYCQVIPFATQRAWFGAKPKSFRHPDEDQLPVISATHIEESSPSLLRTASALVALHPDEATSDIVDAAVRNKIPFFIVPCCVFARVFPDRRTRDGNAVNDYKDLLKYCQEKDVSIKQIQLTFEGKNIALWSTFSD